MANNPLFAWALCARLEPGDDNVKDQVVRTTPGIYVRFCWSLLYTGLTLTLVWLSHAVAEISVIPF